MKNSFSLNYRANCYSGCRKKKKKGGRPAEEKKKKKKKMKMKVDEVDPSREEDDPRLKAKNSSSWERIILACLLSSRA